MATITKKPSGNYQVQIRLSGLKPICKTFPTKTLATKFAREVEGDTKLQQALGKPVSEKISFQKVTDLYADQYTGKDPSNLGRFDWWCDRIGKKPIMEINSIMIDDGLIELAKTRTGSTVNWYKASASAIFSFFIS